MRKFIQKALNKTRPDALVQFDKLKESFEARNPRIGKIIKQRDQDAEDYIAALQKFCESLDDRDLEEASQIKATSDLRRQVIDDALQRFAPATDRKLTEANAKKILSNALRAAIESAGNKLNQLTAEEQARNAELGLEGESNALQAVRAYLQKLRDAKERCDGDAISDPDAWRQYHTLIEF